MPFGYNGKILHVDLTGRNWEIEEPSESWYRTYWGGSALASYYLLRELRAGVDPLSPENVLVFACSVVTGAPLSGFSRYTVAAKSPLTGGFGEAEAGGYFGPELKFAGFDAIVFRGRADKPVYLWINSGQVELRDATGLWGLENGQAVEKIRQELSQPKARIASIGPAGERLILFANVMNELKHANGRSGLGAVMGSKNLKAVVVRGEPDNLSFADPDKVKSLVKWHNKRIREHGPNINLSQHGTPMFVAALNSGGILPTRNFQSGVFEGADKISAQALEETILQKRETCYRCAVGCKRVVAHKATPEHPYDVDPIYGGPEYETLASFGSTCGVDDLPAIAKANELCGRFGLDTISAGASISFAMECFENGILTEADAGGRTVKFGDARGMLWLLEEIINRRGLGDVLAKGVKRAAEEIGRGAEEYCFHIKGQEIPFHDPRGKTGVGLSFALSPTGADHIESPHEVAFQGQAVSMIKPLGLVEPAQPLALDEAKVTLFKQLRFTWSMNNTLGICNFTVAPLFALSYPKLVEAVQAITGWETGLWEFLRAAERSEVMARLFNLREGFGPADDRLFRRLHEPLPEGPLKGRAIDREELHQAIGLYYQMMGWDQEGRPTRGKLIDLGLSWVEA